MSTEGSKGYVPSGEVVDSSWKGLFKWGGAAALAVGVLYFLAIAVVSIMGAPPSSGEAILKYFAGQPTLAYIFFGLVIVTDILLVPVLLDLYLVLKGVNKNAMLGATGFGAVFLVLDMGVSAVTWMALVTLGQNYAAAATDIQRTAYVATANYALGITAVSAPVFGGLVPAIWTIITSLVMLKGVFGKITGYVGMVTGAAGIIYGVSVFVPGLSMFLVVMILLYGIWLILTGAKLYKLGRAM